MTPRSNTTRRTRTRTCCGGAVHDRVVDVGAAFLHLSRDRPGNDEAERIISFEVNNPAPQRLRAHAGDELWTLLTAFYLRETLEESRHTRRNSAIAVVAMAVDEIIAIDDIDPQDVYDDEELY